jgi:hypothetical protein
MWSHYIVYVVRTRLGIDKAVLRGYIEGTGLAVLVLILAHPGLLAWQLWRDGLGLPPGSELNYLPAMKGTILLGMIAFLVFLAYEFRRKYEDRTWWQYVGVATDIAMLMILIHSLRLGTQLQTGWLRIVWYFYGLTLIAALGYIYARKYRMGSGIVAK